MMMMMTDDGRVLRVKESEMESEIDLLELFRGLPPEIGIIPRCFESCP